MGKTYVIRFNVPAGRTWMPKKRAEVFQDRRLKRVKTRANQVKKAVQEYT